MFCTYFIPPFLPKFCLLATCSSAFFLRITIEFAVAAVLTRHHRFEIVPTGKDVCASVSDPPADTLLRFGPLPNLKNPWRNILTSRGSVWFGDVMVSIISISNDSHCSRDVCKNRSCNQ